MKAPEVFFAVESIEVHHGSIDTHEQVVERALTADSEAALHVAFDAELPAPTFLATQFAHRDEHGFGTTSVNNE